MAGNVNMSMFYGFLSGFLAGFAMYTSKDTSFLGEVYTLTSLGATGCLGARSVYYAFNNPFNEK